MGFFTRYLGRWFPSWLERPVVTRITTAQKFCVTPQATDAFGRPVEGTVRWKSSAPYVAKVSKNWTRSGEEVEIVAQAPGRTTIYAISVDDDVQMYKLFVEVVPEVDHEFGFELDKESRVEP
jgi:hypothetical protein